MTEIIERKKETKEIDGKTYTRFEGDNFYSIVIDESEEK